MKILSYKHLDFVPGAVIDENHKDVILVYTHKRNGKLRKRKVDLIGYIFKHPKTKHWAFLQEINWCSIYDSLAIITAILASLDKKRIKYDETKGEFRQ